MKSFITYKHLTLALLTTLLFSCQKDEFLDTPQAKTPETPVTEATQQDVLPQIKLGKKLENPYSVANMKKAYKSLKAKSTLATTSANASTLSNDVEIAIKPTHLYVKFIPKNDEELSILESDSTLILYSYPLDYEIIEGSGYYKDPDVPEGQPTYQYCAVKVDKKLPTDVESEILEELFIPDEDKIEEDVTQNTTSNTATLSILGADNTIEKLVDEALRITNNLDKITKTTAATTNDESNVEALFFKRRPKWRPAGTIKVWDDDVVTTATRRVFSHWEYYDCEGSGIDRPFYDAGPRREQCRRAVYKYETVKTNGGYVPVEGVRVRARRWFTTHTGVANAQGRYSCNGRFRRPANYFIKWKRQDFTIRWSWLSSAKYRGPKKTGDWNLNIKGGTQEFYATIFRAAHHYYYKDIKGLKRPPQDYSWKTKVKISAKYEANGDVDGKHCKDCRWFGIFSRIKIYNPQHNSSEIYANTIHELAHASHWELRRGKWNSDNLAKKVKESWATGVQWELTRMIYPNYRGRERSTGYYTSVVTDMIDEYFENEEDATNFGYTGEKDQVSGYTIKQIEDVLKDTSSWEDWKNNLKNRYENDTEKHLDRLFKAYE